MDRPDNRAVARRVLDKRQEPPSYAFWELRDEFRRQDQNRWPRFIWAVGAVFLLCLLVYAAMEFPFLSDS